MNEPGKIDEKVRALVQQKDLAQAATLALEKLGPELYGFLLATCSSETDAADVFALVSEQLWRGLEKFRWQSSLRTWSYALTRHAVYDHAKRGRRRGAVMVPAGEVSALSQVQERVKSQTLSVFKSQRRTAVEQLRAELPEADRQLLVLRVDRQLQWSELAEVFLEDEAADEEALKREAARLRKRFQLVKEKLLATGKERGLFR